MVTSWSKEKQHCLDLFIEPRGGLTCDLLHHSKPRGRDNSSYLALISGSHGLTASVSDYETALMFAEGFAIASMASYLRKLIYRYSTMLARTVPAQSAWCGSSRPLVSCFKIEWPKAHDHADLGIAAEDLLNNALDDDTLGDGYVSLIHF
jgi:hypothetical protein